MGATAVVTDADGNEKTSGMLAQGDMVKVTSADGKIEVMYNILVNVVSSKLTGVAQIDIYPNPTTGKLNVRGVESGNRIQVYTSTGTLIRDMQVQSNLETLSLEGQPSGIYLIVVSKNSNELLGRFKVSKK
jgi:nitrous oxidase accessory protein NosD